MSVVKDGKLSITLSNELELELPHAFSGFSIESVTEDGQWPCQIHYHDEASMGKVSKSFNITYRKTFAAQVSEVQTATSAAFKEIQDVLNEKAGSTKIKLQFKIHRAPNDLIKSIDVPDGYEVEFHQGLAAMLRIKKNHTASDSNEFVWIVCDFVGETRIGEGAMRLLHASPLRITTAPVAQREYMPVTSTTFSTIEIKMHTSLKTLQIYDSPYNILVVLHFMPRYKRNPWYWLFDHKRPRLDDERHSNVLQQTPSGRSDKDGL